MYRLPQACPVQCRGRGRGLLSIESKHWIWESKAVGLILCPTAASSHELLYCSLQATGGGFISMSKEHFHLPCISTSSLTFVYHQTRRLLLLVGLKAWERWSGEMSGCLWEVRLSTRPATKKINIRHQNQSINRTASRRMYRLTPFLEVGRVFCFEVSL